MINKCLWWRRSFWELKRGLFLGERPKWVENDCFNALEVATNGPPEGKYCASIAYRLDVRFHFRQSVYSINELKLDKTVTDAFFVFVSLIILKLCIWITMLQRSSVFNVKTLSRISAPNIKALMKIISEKHSHGSYYNLCCFNQIKMASLVCKCKCSLCRFSPHPAGIIKLLQNNFLLPL